MVDSVSRVFSVSEYEDVVLIQLSRFLNLDNSQYFRFNIIEEEWDIFRFLIYFDFIVIVIKCKSFIFLIYLRMFCGLNLWSLNLYCILNCNYQDIFECFIFIIVFLYYFFKFMILCYINIVMFDRCFLKQYVFLLLQIMIFLRCRFWMSLRGLIFFFQGLFWFFFVFRIFFQRVFLILDWILCVFWLLMEVNKNCLCLIIKFFIIIYFIVFFIKF